MTTDPGRGPDADASTEPDLDASAEPDARGRRVPRGVVATAAGATLVGAATAWGVFEAQWPVLRRIHVPGVLDPGARPVRILHLSDLHLSSPRSRLVDFLAGLVDEQPDLVVVTGDLLGDVDMEVDAVAALEPLVASGRPGVVVLGSNDFHAPMLRNPLRYLVSDSADGKHGDAGTPLDTDLLVQTLQRRGWTVLRNEAAVLETAAGPVVVSGLDDPHMDASLPAPHEPASPRPAAGLHIGAVHSPYGAALDHLVGLGADLVLAGHTHGGQVRVPGIGALVTNCDLPASKARGLSSHRGVPLHVSAGLGTSRYAPVRFACRPEATVLTLLP